MAWAKIPSAWILNGQLTELTWRQHKSDGTAAMVLLMAIAIRVNESNKRVVEGSERATSVQAKYEDLQALTKLSRAKVAAGLRLLEEHKAIEVLRDARTNRYSLVGITEPGKWAKLPQTYLLYDEPRGLRGFSRFNLRHRNELNAVKLYLLLVAYRNDKGNFTVMSYDKISELSGIVRNDIQPALALLLNYQLVGISQEDPHGDTGHPHNRYRIPGFARY